MTTKLKKYIQDYKNDYNEYKELLTEYSKEWSESAEQKQHILNSKLKEKFDYYTNLIWQTKKEMRVGR